MNVIQSYSSEHFVNNSVTCGQEIDTIVKTLTAAHKATVIKDGLSFDEVQKRHRKYLVSGMDPYLTSFTNAII